MKKFNSLSETMKAAYIGAAATIIGAIIGGIFLLRSISANQPNASPTPQFAPITSATTQSTNLTTTTVSSSPAAPSTPGSTNGSSYPIQLPLSISASCHGMQIDITSVEIRNEIVIALNMTFTNNSSTDYQQNQLSPVMSLANTEKHRFAQAGAYGFPPLYAHMPTNLSFDFVPLDTSSGTTYVLSWKLVNNSPGDTWSCTFPQENITLNY